MSNQTESSSCVCRQHIFGIRLMLVIINNIFWGKGSMAWYSLGLLEIIDHCSAANMGPKKPWSSLISSFQFSSSGSSTRCCWPRVTCPRHVPASGTRSRHVRAPAWHWGAPWTRRGAGTSTASSGTRRTGGSTSTARWWTSARWVTNYMRNETFRPPFSNRFKRNLLTSRAPEVYLWLKVVLVGKLASIKIAKLFAV